MYRVEVGKGRLRLIWRTHGDVPMWHIVYADSVQVRGLEQAGARI